MNTIEKLKTIIEEFEASENEEVMDRTNTNIINAIPSKKNLKDLLPVISKFKNKLIRIHLLCLLINPHETDLITALKREALESSDYIDLSTALAGLKLAEVEMPESEILRLTNLLPNASIDRANDEINERYKYYLTLKKPLS